MAELTIVGKPPIVVAFDWPVEMEAIRKLSKNMPQNCRKLSKNYVQHCDGQVINGNTDEATIYANL